MNPNNSYGPFGSLFHLLTAYIFARASLQEATLSLAYNNYQVQDKGCVNTCFQLCLPNTTS